MKGSKQFKMTIQKYLDNRAANDELFAAVYKKEGKTIDDCVTYILNTVQKSGCNGFPDDEIYSMAVHYYDEDDIEVGKPMDVTVVVNHKVELTEEDKVEAKQQAVRELVEQSKTAMKKKVETPKKVDVVQTSLF